MDKLYLRPEPSEGIIVLTNDKSTQAKDHLHGNGKLQHYQDRVIKLILKYELQKLPGKPLPNFVHVLPSYRAAEPLPAYSLKTKLPRSPASRTWSHML